MIRITRHVDDGANWVMVTEFSRLTSVKLNEDCIRVNGEDMNGDKIHCTMFRPKCGYILINPEQYVFEEYYVIEYDGKKITVGDNFEEMVIQVNNILNESILANI